jgi:hypothetical protein
MPPRCIRPDPEIILQAAAFEIVTPGVESVAIPERVFQAVRSTGREPHFSLSGHALRRRTLS